jgi:hypothetical protein
VADYLQDTIEQHPDLAAHLAGAENVLIHNFDAAISTCIQLDRPRNYRVLYQHPPFAQKQAQALWNRLAQARKLEWAKRITLLPEESYREQAYGQPYDLIYKWMPFSRLRDMQEVTASVKTVATALQPEGLAFIVGLASMANGLQTLRLRIVEAVSVDQLPTFRMHQSILPKARVKAELMLFQVQKV